MEHLNLQALADNLSLFAFIYLCVFGAIVMDLWSGVRKARRRHELRMSNGYKRTVDKIARYYNMLLVVSDYGRAADRLPSAQLLLSAVPALPDDHRGAVPLLHRAEKHLREGGGQDQVRGIGTVGREDHRQQATI
ncbi:MAG: hypothetical protein ACLR8Y_04040 [Alistipes indistinctus]